MLCASTLFVLAIGALASVAASASLRTLAALLLAFLRSLVRLLDSSSQIAGLSAEYGVAWCVQLCRLAFCVFDADLHSPLEAAQPFEAMEAQVLSPAADFTWTSSSESHVSPSESAQCVQRCEEDSSSELSTTSAQSFFSCLQTSS